MHSSLRTTCLAAALLGAGIASALADEVSITRLSGSVTFLVDGKPATARAGSRLSTPLRITTGADGSLRIEHSSAAFDIGPGTTILLPGETKSGVEKILQSIGRVMYSVRPRASRSFAVETPYLVSVVKGTTFAVAVDESSTAVALLEGSVEVFGSDTDQRILLEPNQSARRHQGQREILVTEVNATAPPLEPQAQLDRAPLQFGSPSPVDTILASQSAVITSDLHEISAAYADRPLPVETPAPGVPQPAPDEPVPVPSPIPPLEPPVLQPPLVTPIDPAPETTPPPVVPMPPADDDDDDDDDDGDNGHGNDDDGRDSSNPGRN